jgi:hypothetical protein
LRYDVNMTQPDDLIIERTADLDMDSDQLWELISTTDGWRSWLVDETDVVVAADASGTAIDDGIVREVRINAIIDSALVEFTWWDRDDPMSTSIVHLEIVELPEGRSQLRITEQFAGSSAATMSAATAQSWEVRLVSLWLLALHCTVMA